METLFIIDGSNNLYRSYYAIRGLTNSRGLATNAAYGFTQMLRKLLKDHQPDAVAVAFDTGGVTVRHEQFVDYKKDRKPMPDDLSVQIPYVREICEGFGIPVLEIERYEADDMIGSLACKARDLGYRVVLATSDKDFFQLVGNGILLYHTGREAMYDEQGVEAAFGLPPSKVVDVMAIWGDAIDNIPGVPGIGEKGAKQLIQEFGSLDELLANVDTVPRKSHREKLDQYRDQALMSRDLARIHCDLDVDFEIERFRLRPPDREKLHRLFADLEFQSLMQEYMPAKVETHEYRVIGDPDELGRFLSGTDHLAFHLEAEAGGEQEPVAITLSSHPGVSAVVPLADVFGGSETLRGRVRELLASERRLIAHDVKLQLRRLMAGGWPLPRNFDDTMILSYVLQPGLYGHAMENLSRGRISRDCITRKELDKQNPQFTLNEMCREYLGEKSDVTLALYHSLEKELQESESLRRVYAEIEIPLVPILARMEERGVRIDPDLLRSMSMDLGRQLETLEKSIYAEAGQVFNINSPPQLATILFEKLQYPVLKKTQKTKSFSTGVEVLTELASKGFAVPRLILEHRELHKLKSTYVDALPALADTRGRLHTSFNQAIAATGRLSSSDPNLQNIPIRTEQGRQIRKAFLAEEGHLLLSADYSQIELRVLAHMSSDPDLIDAFKRAVDIHRATAARIFGVNEALVTPDQRRASKTINFGVLYGMSAFRLGNELGIPTGEAKAFIDAYFARYPTIRNLLDRTLEEARATGRVSTLFGRVRYIPEIHNRSWTVRGNAERMATNAPIQGTAADLLKLAMIAVDRALQEREPGAAMLLTVHDEIVIELLEDRLEPVRELVRSTMENIYPLAVPLSVDTHWGRTWYDAKV
ncbi:MAG TPA: DNA polymerase I [Thermoanaerobaculia bacterium]|nr:DNA polymerase I [Thermoanaerobaculia bacterium]